MDNISALPDWTWPVGFVVIGMIVGAAFSVNGVIRNPGGRHLFGMFREVPSVAVLFSVATPLLILAAPFGSLFQAWEDGRKGRVNIENAPEYLGRIVLSFIPLMLLYSIGAWIVGGPLSGATGLAALATAIVGYGLSYLSALLSGESWAWYPILIIVVALTIGYCVNPGQHRGSYDQDDCAIPRIC